MFDINIYIWVVHIVLITATVIYVYILLRKLAEQFRLAGKLLILALVAIHGILPLHDLSPKIRSLGPHGFNLIWVCFEDIEQIFLKVHVENVEFLTVFRYLNVSVLLIKVLNIFINIIVVFKTLDLHRFKLHLQPFEFIDILPVKFEVITLLHVDLVMIIQGCLLRITNHAA